MRCIGTISVTKLLRVIACIKIMRVIIGVITFIWVLLVINWLLGVIIWFILFMRRNIGIVRVTVIGGTRVSASH